MVEGDPPGRKQHGLQQVEQLDHHPVAAQAQNLAMELQVVEQVPLTVVAQRHHGDQMGAQPLQVYRARPPGGHLRRSGLEHAPKLDDFGQDLVGRPRLAPGDEQLGGELVPVLLGQHHRSLALPGPHHSYVGQRLSPPHGRRAG